MNPFSPFNAIRLGIVALVLCSPGANAAEGAALKPADTKAAAAVAAKGGDAKSAALAAKEKVKKGGMTPAEIRKLFEEVSKQRDVMIADFEMLVKQMKDATEEQKKQIKEKLEAQKKAFEEVTSALHKQIREEQRKQRQNAAPTKR